jgi:hypothetical protein
MPMLAELADVIIGVDTHTAAGLRTAWAIEGWLAPCGPGPHAHQRRAPGHRG